jgi:hypothetical protein
MAHNNSTTQSFFSTFHFSFIAFPLYQGAFIPTLKARQLLNLFWFFLEIYARNVLFSSTCHVLFSRGEGQLRGEMQLS